MKFLLTYSNRQRAKERGLPPAGTVVQFTTLEGLQGYANASGVGPVIIHKSGYEPEWLGYHELEDEEDHKKDHVVHTLPPRLDQMTWIEVYNGLRE